MKLITKRARTFGQILSGRATDKRGPRLLGNWWQPHLKRKNNDNFLKERCSQQQERLGHERVYETSSHMYRW